MATWDAAWCAADMQQRAARPENDVSLTTTVAYGYLTKAQNRIVAMIASRFPECLYPETAYSGIPTGTTTDGGLTFTFGTDANGYAIAPIGKTSLYRQLADIPDWPMQEGVDFIRNGATGVMIPNNQPYTGTLYWRGIAPPADIGASSDPVLFPEASRELIVLEAVRQYASAGAINPDLAGMAAQDFAGVFPQWMLTWRTQFRKGGALGVGYSGLQLAVAAQL